MITKFLQIVKAIKEQDWALVAGEPLRPTSASIHFHRGDGSPYIRVDEDRKSVVCNRSSQIETANYQIFEDLRIGWLDRAVNMNLAVKTISEIIFPDEADVTYKKGRLVFTARDREAEVTLTDPFSIHPSYRAQRLEYKCVADNLEEVHRCVWYRPPSHSANFICEHFDLHDGNCRLTPPK